MRFAWAIQKIEFVFSAVDFVLPMRDSRNQKEELQDVGLFAERETKSLDRGDLSVAG